MVDLAPAPPVTVKQLVEVPPTDEPLEGVGGKDSAITEKLPLLSSMRLLEGKRGFILGDIVGVMMFVTRKS